MKEQRLERVAKKVANENALLNTISKTPFPYISIYEVIDTAIKLAMPGEAVIRKYADDIRKYAEQNPGLLNEGAAHRIFNETRQSLI